MIKMTSNSDNLQLQVLKGDFIKLRVAIKELIQEVQQHSGSQTELDELAALTRLKFSNLNTQIEELERLYQEEEDPEERNLLNKEIEDWKVQVQDERLTFRNALLMSQLAVTQRNRDELFGIDKSKNDSEGNDVRRRDKMSKELMMKKSAQLTVDLLTVTRMIRDNTEKSSKTVEKLVESSQMVESTQEELKTMGSVIGQARKILSKYGRRENTDKLLIFLGLIFFLASCLVVVRNRFIFIF